MINLSNWVLHHFEKDEPTPLIVTWLFARHFSDALRDINIRYNNATTIEPVNR
ncbi:MAG: hypothetical protein WAK17_12905 [Candidatus Nitrosopolaris sp.]|jgi:hypothetical protein